MVTQAPRATNLQAAASPVTERKAKSAAGVGILIYSVIGLVVAIVLLLAGIFNKSYAGLIIPGALLFIPVVLGFQGLTPVIPGEARVAACLMRSCARRSRPSLSGPICPRHRQISRSLLLGTECRVPAGLGLRACAVAFPVYPRIPVVRVCHGMARRAATGIPPPAHRHSVYSISITEI